MADEQPSATVADPGAAPTSGVRDRFWFQALAVVVLLVALGLVVVRSSHADVVQSWEVLASCPAPAGTAPATVTTLLDTSACVTAPSHSVSGRGWPIVPFVVPETAGTDLTITKVHSDKNGRTMSVDTASTAKAATGHGVVIVFIEVPAESLPSTPFTLEGASGSVIVSAIPAT